MTTVFGKRIVATSSGKLLFFSNLMFFIMVAYNENLNIVGRYLLKRNESVSVAESVTSGLLQTVFSHMVNAESFYKGGLTAYNLEQKVNLLNLDYGETKAVNCVSRNITEQMALNVAKLFNTDWGIATTGFTTPAQESNNEIYAYYCISHKGKIIRSDRIDLHPMTKAIDAQNYFVEYVIGCLKCEVERGRLEVVD